MEKTKLIMIKSKNNELGLIELIKYCKAVEDDINNDKVIIVPSFNDCEAELYDLNDDKDFVLETLYADMVNIQNTIDAIKKLNE